MLESGRKQLIKLLIALYSPQHLLISNHIMIKELQSNIPAKFHDKRLSHFRISSGGRNVRTSSLSNPRYFRFIPRTHARHPFFSGFITAT